MECQRTAYENAKIRAENLLGSNDFWIGCLKDYIWDKRKTIQNVNSNDDVHRLCKDFNDYLDRKINQLLTKDLSAFGIQEIKELILRKKREYTKEFSAVARGRLHRRGCARGISRAILAMIVLGVLAKNSCTAGCAEVRDAVVKLIDER